jgi:hypothetical protein
MRIPPQDMELNGQFSRVELVSGARKRGRNDIYLVWMANWIDTEDRLPTLVRNGALKLLYTYRL